MLVISCHADTNFHEHFLHKAPDGAINGHLDNFAGVHAVMLAFFSGKLPARGVRIELTYGEEVDFAGAHEVCQTLNPDDVVLVVDVTGTPSDKDIVIEKCRRPELRQLIERALADIPYDIYEDCPDPVCNEDETDVYSNVCPMNCFVGIPVFGGDYNEGAVMCREKTIPAVADAICRIARTWAQENLLDR